jgi:hypothetical protein
LNIVKKLKDIGIVFGEAFQILDDIDDREGDKKILEEQLKRRCHILVKRTKNLKGSVDLLLDVIKATFTDFVKI